MTLIDIGYKQFSVLGRTPKTLLQVRFLQETLHFSGNERKIIAAFLFMTMKSSRSVLFIVLCFFKISKIFVSAGYALVSSPISFEKSLNMLLHLLAKRGITVQQIFRKNESLILQPLYETFILFLLSNICKMKKEEKRLSYVHCARGEKQYEKTNR